MMFYLSTAMLKQGISKMAPTCQMSAELNYVQEPLSVLCGHECPVGGTFRVTVVCRIAVFLSSEELAEADGECHIPFNTLPSCQKANSFDFPSNHSTFLPSLPSTCVHIHTHHRTLVFRSEVDCYFKWNQTSPSRPSIYFTTLFPQAFPHSPVHHQSLEPRGVSDPSANRIVFSVCLFGFCLVFFPMDPLVFWCPPRQARRQ